MNIKTEEAFFEVDDYLCKVVNTVAARRAFVMKNDGSLKEVSPNRICAVGIPIDREDFYKEQNVLTSNNALTV